MQARAYVEGKLVAEAEISGVIVDRESQDFSHDANSTVGEK
jgi:hypothetical protein